MNEVRKKLEALCEAYAAEFRDDGYDQRDMIDYVVIDTLKPDLDALSQRHGIGVGALIGWYEGRVIYLKRVRHELESKEIALGAPSEEQRARRGKVC